MTFAAPAKLALFCAWLALVGGVAALAGAANESAGSPAATADDAMHMQSGEPGRTDGLASSVAGYTFVPERTVLPPGKPTELRFRDPRRGGPVCDGLRSRGRRALAPDPRAA